MMNLARQSESDQPRSRAESPLLQSFQISQFSQVLLGNDAAVDEGQPALAYLRPLRCIYDTARMRQNIYFSGEFIEDVLLICEGWAFKYRQLSSGKRQILSFLLPGDLVSGTAAFQDTLPFSVQTLTNVRYCKVKRSDLKARLTSDPTLFDALADILVAECREFGELLTDLGLRTAEERIAGLILRLMRRLNVHEPDAPKTFEFPIRQQHIADATGLTPVHVSRVFADFRRRNLVELGGGMLSILNHAEFQRLGALR
jgi:CRP/FNR family transcriptional regulator, anaerobic regulatory protein